MKEALIFETVRTAKASSEEDGGLTSIKPIELLSPLVETILTSKNLAKSSINELIIGCATQRQEQGCTLALALCSSLGLDKHTASSMISKGRASAFEAIEVTALKTIGTKAKLGLAVTVHSSSRHSDMLVENMLLDDPKLYRQMSYIPLNLAADSLATMRGFSRRDLDQYALLSHQKASKAYQNGYFKRSLKSLRDNLDQPLLSYDELVKQNISMEDLAKVRPFYQIADPSTLAKAYDYFDCLDKIHHFHHGGNSAPDADAAATVLIGNKAAMKEYGLQARAKIRSLSFSGQKEEHPFSAQKSAVELALQEAKLEIGDIDLFEVDEAYAALALNFIDQFEINAEVINVNGGSIATGEANGTTAIFMLTHLLDELERREARLGLITQYIEHNQVQCLIIERLGDENL